MCFSAHRGASSRPVVPQAVGIGLVPGVHRYTIREAVSHSIESGVDISSVVVHHDPRCAVVSAF